MTVTKFRFFHVDLLRVIYEKILLLGTIIFRGDYRLVAIVEGELERDAYTGALFLFCNKAKDKLKVVYWDKTGFALWYKRLEKQKFKWPNKATLQEFELSPQQLDWLL